MIDSDLIKSQPLIPLFEKLYPGAKRKGSSYQCPFHGGNGFNLAYNKGKNYLYCFSGCGGKGYNHFSILKEALDIEGKEAFDYLKTFYDLGAYDDFEAPVPTTPKREKERALNHQEFLDASYLPANQWDLRSFFDALVTFFPKEEIKRVFSEYKIRIINDEVFYPVFDDLKQLKAVYRVNYNGFNKTTPETVFWDKNGTRNFRAIPLFGAHLIKNEKYQSARIFIVESPQSALLGNLFFEGKFLFLSGFEKNIENYLPYTFNLLKNRQVAFIADPQNESLWKECLNQYAYPFNINQRLNEQADDLSKEIKTLLSKEASLEEKAATLGVAGSLLNAGELMLAKLFLKQYSK